MARLPALVEQLGLHHPRGAAGVENYARILRKAKKITPSKRGVGASEMSAADVTNLLLSFAEMGNAHHAPVAVDMLRNAILLGVDEGEVDPMDKAGEFVPNLDFRTLGSLIESLLLQFATADDRPPYGYVQLDNPSILGGDAGVVFKWHRFFQDNDGRTRGACDSVTLRYLVTHPDADELSEGYGAGEILGRLQAQAAHSQPGTGITPCIKIPLIILWMVARRVLTDRGDKE